MLSFMKENDVLILPAKMFMNRNWLMIYLQKITHFSRMQFLSSPHTDIQQKVFW